MDDLSTYIANLEGMSVKELQIVWKDFFDIKPDQTNKSYLIRRIAYRVQELKYGGLKSAIVKLLNCNVKEADVKSKSKSRIKIGAVLTRVYKGVEFRVTIIENGYEFNGMIYKSLTRIAGVITDSKTSGPLFFGVKE